MLPFVPPLFDEISRTVPNNPRAIPIDLFVFIFSSPERKSAKIKIIIGIVDMHRPTNMEVR